MAASSEVTFAEFIKTEQESNGKARPKLFFKKLKGKVFVVSDEDGPVAIMSHNVVLMKASRHITYLQTRAWVYQEKYGVRVEFEFDTAREPAIA